MKELAFRQAEGKRENGSESTLAGLTSKVKLTAELQCSSYYASILPNLEFIEIPELLDSDR